MTDRKEVPREPTREMIAAGKVVTSGPIPRVTIWQAMYDAAPEAADRIAAQEQRADSLSEANDMLLERAEAAEALCAEFERDAKRYRWLIDNMVGYGMHMGAVLYTPELVSPRHMTADEADAAIDAARKGKP